MAKGQQRSNREAKKPKKTAAERAKTSAPAPVLASQRTPPKAPKKR
jgi:hypothetical protein